jgi:hypothetical protein
MRIGSIFRCWAELILSYADFADIHVPPIKPWLDFGWGFYLKNNKNQLAQFLTMIESLPHYNLIISLLRLPQLLNTV